MAQGHYALVAYLPGRLGEFVDRLRRRLNPAFAAWLAHVTILPPRLAEVSPEVALALVREKCACWEPFEVTLDGVSTFWPTNGVVYLACSAGSEQLIQLHDTLSGGGLVQQEAYEYVPHVTIAQELDEAGTQTVLAEATREWAQFGGENHFRVESLSLVQQVPENRWVELGWVPLGVLSTPRRK